MMQADVMSIRKRINKIPVIEYWYEVNGVSYQATQSIKDQSMLKNAEASRHVLIEYYCHDASISRVK